MPMEPLAPRPLVVAVWLVIAEAVVEGAYVLSRDDFGLAGRVLLLGAFAAKVGCALLARSLVPAGVLGLLAFELVGILVALAAPWMLAARLLLVLTVVSVYALVLPSLRAFPSPELPRP